MTKRSIQYIGILFLGMLSLTLMSQGTANAATAADYALVPPFLTNQEPPQVLLVMDRSHKLYYEAYNDASDLNEDGGLDVGYKGEDEVFTDSNGNGVWDAAESYVDTNGNGRWNTGEPFTDSNNDGNYNPAEPLTDINGDHVWNKRIDYYGYFDSYKCYVYDSANNRFRPNSAPHDGAGDPIKQCSGASEWSGDYLNYLSMSRMDTLRRVLYGGKRSVDTASLTVLQRAYVPQDAHSWGKEYESVARDGYDIRKYTPLDIPAAGTRHLLASTTLDANGNRDGSDDPPLLRVWANSSLRIWDWVAKEGPVVNTPTIPAPTPEIETDPIADHAEFNAILTEFATIDHLQGTVSVTDVNQNSATNVNPKMTDPDEYYISVLTATLKIRSVANYTNRFDFGIDGDDEVELVIHGVTGQGLPNDEFIVGWYGGHGVEGGYSHHGTVTLPNGDYVVEFRYHEMTGNEAWKLRYKRQKTDTTWDPSWLHVTNAAGMLVEANWQQNFYNLVRSSGVASTLTDYQVNVVVCDPSLLEANCKQYPGGNYKPTGLLQRYGESDSMKFGLMSGSYRKNTMGGVLRKNIGTITNEINATNGTFLVPATGGIIDNINKFRVVDFQYSTSPNTTGGQYINCGWITTRPMNDAGECVMWGNPTSEMMYEGMRYFAGKKTPTADFTYATPTYDSNLGLSLPNWIDPYLPAEGGGQRCAKPFMLVLSDINPSYDSNQVPGNFTFPLPAAVPSFGGSGAIAAHNPNLDVNNLSDTIFTQESMAGTHFIGQENALYDGACTAKNVTDLGETRGLCPEEPTKQGSYYSAAVAYYGNRYDISASANGNQNVTSYAVAMASSLPKINIKVGTHTITLLPFAKTIDGGGLNRAEGSFQPTMTIVDFFVEQITDTHGVFRVNFEDVEQGADHDMDAIVRYEYTVNADNTVTVTLNSIYASMGYRAHLGYIISGTANQDGVYLELRDISHDQASDASYDYFLDTPDACTKKNTPVNCWQDHAGLPNTHSRVFSPGTNPAATLLNDPLWYAAKWGGFIDQNTPTEDVNDNGVLDVGEDLNGNGAIDYTATPVPDLAAEWDEDGNGTPDNYFYVVNPLRLEEQLNKSFAAILRRAASGTAASVISNSRSGEGAIYQSIFFPQLKIGNDQLSWIGEVHSLFMDAFSNMREDTNGNHQLNIHEEDLNGNGVIDINVNEDANNNHVLDTGEDLNHNGKLDSNLNEDLDGDGILDTRDMIIRFDGQDVYKTDDINENQLVDNEDQIVFEPDITSWHNNAHLDTEDLNGNKKLDAGEDLNGNGILDFEDKDGNGSLTIETEIGPYSLTTTDPIQSIKYLWSAEDWLNDFSLDPLIQRAYTLADHKRYIFTFIDQDKDGIVDTGEQVPFSNVAVPVPIASLTDVSKIYPYLTLYPSFTDKPAWVANIDLAGSGTVFRQAQAQRIVEYIRGRDQGGLTYGTVQVPEMRNRQFYDSNENLIKTWRLGDIVHSSPTLVGRPAEAFHLLYNDRTYGSFVARYLTRRSVIYTGANDGMIHAFNAGFFDSKTTSFLTTLGESFTDLNGDGNYDAGVETFTDSDGDGHFDGNIGETYDDADMDGHYDKAEPYTDVDSDGHWDAAEPYTDSNTNLSFDAGDNYTDADGDCHYDAKEPFTDTDHDGNFDEVEEPYTDTNHNGQYDNAEPYTDTNHNGHYDLGEPFVDNAPNGTWDDAEVFTDLNTNGTYDLGEPFVDSATCPDGIWNGAEAYIDTNGNGHYDAGETFVDSKPCPNTVWDGGEPYFDTDSDGHHDKAETYFDTDGDGKWDSGETYSDLDGNGVFTAGEAYTDTDGDCHHDAAEPYTDTDNDGHYDSGETFVDRNGNGKYDGVEQFVDSNGNGTYDLGEPFVDLDGDHHFDTPESFIDTDHDGHFDPTYEPYVDANGNGVYDTASQTAYPLGSELWAYVPYNLLPHLYWLTEADYPHIYYNDLKPKVFDAKIFFKADGTALDDDHPNGWGTVMVVGMRFGGASITADMNKNDVVDAADRTMSSAYAVFDISNPEAEPRVLAEIALPGQGYTTCYPAAFAMRTKQTSGNSPTFGTNDWYLVFGSGPADSGGIAASHKSIENILKQGISKQAGKFFVLDLKKIAQATSPVISTINENGDPTITAPFFIQQLEPNSFVSQPVTVDYNLDFNADTVYFGTISGDETNGWAGRMRRLLVNNEASLPTATPTGHVAWTGLNADAVDRADNWLINLAVPVENGQPITVPATISVGNRIKDSHGVPLDVNGDGVVNDFDRERWVFFGTGRFLVRDDAENTDQQSFYGIKEPIGASNHFSGGTVNRSNLLNVTNAETYDEMEVAGVQVAKVTGLSGITTWEQLLEQIDLHDGWYQNFSEPKERNIGQASMFDEILAFTTYVPALDICAFEGESWLSAVYYRTGTASFENIIGFIHDDVNHNSIVDPGEQRMIKKVNLGRGLALTVNLHTGRAEGAAGLAQNSLGNIVKKKFTNVNTKSRKVSWQLR